MASQRKQYARPRLTTYGRVGTLTQAGSILSPEGSGRGNSGTTRQRSDRNLKTNITRIGSHPSGIGLYLFEYRPELRDACGHGRRLGCMVDEVEIVCPEAIHRDSLGNGWVDYAMLGIRLPS